MLMSPICPHTCLGKCRPLSEKGGLMMGTIMWELSLASIGMIIKYSIFTVIYILENDYDSGEVIDVNAGRYMD